MLQLLPYMNPTLQTQICKGNYDEGEGHTCECPQFCDYTELIVPDYVCSNYCEEHFNECAVSVIM